MYPAKPGSEVGKEYAYFDVRSLMPAGYSVPDEDNKLVTANTYADLPIDDAHGPYPVVIFLHGTAAFRVASASNQAHWASHGFIVMAADHDGICITYVLENCDLLALPPIAPDTYSSDVDAEIAALSNPTGDLAFLAGHVDTSRIAIGGHSAGAVMAAQFTNKPNVQVVMLMSGNHAVSPSSSLKSTVYIGGIDDAVLPYPAGAVNLLTGVYYPGSQTDAYNASPAKKRLLGIANAGHLSITDVCDTNNAGLNSVEVLLENNPQAATCVAGIQLMWDCPTGTPWKTAGSIVSDMSVAVLEETLHCQDRAAVISNIKSRHPEVGELKEQLQ